MTDQEDPKMEFKTVTSTLLLEGLRDSDNSVWQQFVERYRPLLERYAIRNGFAGADAQDIAQLSLVTFCQAYQDGKYDREKGRLRHWLFGIAHNQVRNARKRRSRKELNVFDETSQTNFFDRQPEESELEAVWEEEWRQALLRQCLEEIRREVDDKSVEAFELFAWKGHSAKEVADKLDMSPNAVFIVKHRIMKRIRELLPRMEEIF
ncbi:MAG: RNA polymerase sigma factor [Phycisphaerae bacterium]